MIKAVILLAAILAVPLWAAAVSATDIMGVEIGKPMSLPECKKERGKYKDFWLTERCWTPALTAKDSLVVWLTMEDIKVFDFVPDRSFMVRLEGGAAAVVYVPTNGIDSQEIVYEALHGKYGEPTEFSRVEKQNRMGASFTVIEAFWLKPDAEIHFSGAARQIDSGSVFAMSAAHARTLEKQSEAKKPQF